MAVRTAAPQFVAHVAPLILNETDLLVSAACSGAKEYPLTKAAAIAVISSLVRI